MTGIAERLRRIRRTRGLNKSEMVDLVKQHGLPKTTFATYSGWESGKVEPKPVYLLALETALEQIEQRDRRN
jgi:transcriptional regulator with XRE-family HTH domain